jgi:hypothetical protein
MYSTDLAQDTEHSKDFLNTVMTSGFHKMSGIRWIAERLVAPQEVSSCIVVIFEFRTKLQDTQIVHKYVTLVITWNSRGTSHDRISYTSTGISWDPTVTSTIRRNLNNWSNPLFYSVLRNLTTPFISTTWLGRLIPKSWTSAIKQDVLERTNRLLSLIQYGSRRKRRLQEFIVAEEKFL